MFRLLSRRASMFALFLGLLLVVGTPASAQASTTYPVPDSGLNFDARDSDPTNACTTGFGNLLTSPAITQTDEVNYLKANDSLRYKNVANIGGQAIDAVVTLVSVTGMQTQTFSSTPHPTLRRLDKCDIDADTRLVEIGFTSVSARPNDSNFVLRFDFFLSGSTNTATLTNLKMNVEDIDNNQYLEVDNFTSARLAPGRAASDLQEYSNGQSIQVGGGSSVTLSTTATARRFHALGSSDGSDPVAERDKHVAEITYASTNSITLKLGVFESGGGSFDLDFRGFSFQSDTQTPTSSSEGSPEPATHLDLKARTGQPGAGTPVLMEGEGLLPGSAYSLVLREPARVIRSGTANTGGRFSHLEALPADLKPGSYTITLSAIGKNGESLVLTQSFRIGSNGSFTQIGTPVPTVKGGLAQTGPNPALILGGLSLAGIVALVGVTLSWTSTRRLRQL